jgi:hypothetical protein
LALKQTVLLWASASRPMMERLMGSLMVLVMSKVLRSHPTLVMA